MQLSPTILLPLSCFFHFYPSFLSFHYLFWLSFSPPVHTHSYTGGRSADEIINYINTKSGTKCLCLKHNVPTPPSIFLLPLTRMQAPVVA